MKRHSVLIALGREIHRRRLALGMSLDALGQAAKLSPNYVMSIEAGERNPSMLSMLSLAEALDAHVGDLVGGVQELTAEGLEAGRLLAALPPAMAGPVLELLRALVGDWQKQPA